jgi:hypothetical protein
MTIEQQAKVANAAIKAAGHNVIVGTVHEDDVRIIFRLADKTLLDVQKGTARTIKIQGTFRHA